MKAAVVPCHGSPTGYAYATECGGCSCQLAPPPGVAMYRGELAALEHEQALFIAQAMNDTERLEELAENPPHDYQRMLAVAVERIKNGASNG